MVRLRNPDWIVVCFRGTTPSPMRGLLREGQVNSMAGQERWVEAPEAMREARVHRGYAAAYRSILADVEGAAADWARRSAVSSQTLVETKPPPRVVVVGHSLGGALAALCAARRAAGVRANSKVKILAAESDCYVARVVGDEQELTVKLGPRYDLPPDLVPEKGHEWELVAAGNEYAVWARPRNAKGDAKSAR